MMLTGWLFDIYPSVHGVTLWFIDTEGRKHRAYDLFTPSCYLRVTERDTDRVAALLRAFPFPVQLSREARREVYSNKDWNVLRVAIGSTLHFKTVIQRLERHLPHFVFFNSDISPQQLYLYDTGLFPLAYGDYDINEEGRLVGWTLHDAADALEYVLPPLTTLTLKNRPDVVSPKYRKLLQLEVSYDGTTYAMESHAPEEVLGALTRHIQRCDPDIILTEYGDAVLLPLLARLANEHHMPLPLNRDTTMGYITTAQSSYFAYGKIVHKDGAFELAGRWHLDVENSFMMGEASLDGVAEIARLTQLPVQHQSRSTIGTALSSMQLSWAYRNGYLIPARKREPEDFKPADVLLLADRGGLIFQPVMGYHEQVAELDFVSMYPTIMVKHNVSPETVNCHCCHNEAVPELGYTICERREGIVPATLRTVVHKRGIYKKEKKRLKLLGDERWKLYDRRQNALKWMLVTCFGYLGYKNARFGRIEAHESVNAFSRDAILRAKEIAEGQGFHFLHAIVDCMWLHRPGATEADYEALAREVSNSVGIDISLEGIYNWILYPPSKMDPRIPTANRYVGWYTNNEIKIRGIEIRRRDTPVFIKRLQGEMLKVMGEAKTLPALETLVPAVLATAKEFVDLLRSGRADPLQLVVRRHISQEAGEYTNRSANAIVSQALDEAGVHLAPGESVEYIIIDASGKRNPEKAKAVALYSLDDGYDIEKYTEMALKAVETLLLPFGYDAEKLRGLWCPLPVRTKRQRPIAAASGQQELFSSG
jgi:DNA polymerase elongation subunit (family B)